MRTRALVLFACLATVTGSLAAFLGSRSSHWRTPTPFDKQISAPEFGPPQDRMQHSTSDLIPKDLVTGDAPFREAVRSQDQVDRTRIVLRFMYAEQPTAISGLVRVVWSPSRLDPDVADVTVAIDKVAGIEHEINLPTAARIAALQFFLEHYTASPITVDSLRHLADGRLQPTGEVVREVMVNLIDQTHVHQLTMPAGQVFVDGEPRCPNGLRVVADYWDGEYVTQLEVSVHPASGRFVLDRSLEETNGLWCTSDETIAQWIDGTTIRSQWRLAGNRIDLNSHANAILKIHDESGMPLTSFHLKSRYLTYIQSDGGRLLRAVERMHKSDGNGVMSIEGLPATEDVSLFQRVGKNWELVHVLKGPRPMGEFHDEIEIVRRGRTFTVWGILPDAMSLGVGEDVELKVCFHCPATSDPSRVAIVDAPNSWRASCDADKSWAFELFAGDQSLSEPILVEANAGDEIGPIAFALRRYQYIDLSWIGLPASSTLTCFRIAAVGNAKSSSALINGVSSIAEPSGSRCVGVEETTTHVVGVVEATDGSWCFREARAITRDTRHIALSFSSTAFAAEVIDASNTWPESSGRIHLVRVDLDTHVRCEGTVQRGKVNIPLILPAGKYFFAIEFPASAQLALGIVESTGLTSSVYTWNGAAIPIEDAVSRWGERFLVQAIDGAVLKELPDHWRIVDLSPFTPRSNPVVAPPLDDTGVQIDTPQLLIPHDFHADGIVH